MKIQQRTIAAQERAEWREVVSVPEPVNAFLNSHPVGSEITILTYANGKYEHNEYRSVPDVKAYAKVSFDIELPTLSGNLPMTTSEFHGWLMRVLNNSFPHKAINIKVEGGQR